MGQAQLRQQDAVERTERGGDNYADQQQDNAGEIVHRQDLITDHYAGGADADGQQGTGGQIDATQQNDMQHTQRHQRHSRDLTKDIGNIGSCKELPSGDQLQCDAQDQKGRQGTYPVYRTDNALDGAESRLLIFMTAYLPRMLS